MIELYKDKVKCTGCSACYNACNFDSISMYFDEEGFVYPEIDHTSCTECGNCVAVCPIDKENSSDCFQIPQFYSMISKDKESLLKSSSGGIFSLLADNVFHRKGYVYGCILDKNNKAIHVGINSENDIEKMRGSKYVQSEINLIYQDVKKKLKQNYPILFTGTPCQVDGLRRYLKKQYKNLFLVEVLCHGVPSPKLFEKHIARLETKYNGKVQNYEMRSKKKFGWGSENRTYYEINKNGKTKGYHPYFSEYFTSFFYGISLRPSCYECKYSTIKRHADLTLGDFWGYWNKYKKHFKEGISVISVNSHKGENLLNSIKDRTVTDNLTLNEATKTNIHFLKPVRRMPQRDIFYKDLQKYGYNNIYSQVYFKYKIKKHILRTFYGRFVPNSVRVFINKTIRTMK